MSRLTSVEADALMDEPIPVLDQGFVRLVDYMGGDAAIVQAARVSYGEGTKTVREDRNLINYLMRHRHTTPFEMVELKFHVKLPIFVARQWIRHRTANVNEQSLRYSVMPDEFYLPAPDSIGVQSKSNRQGRTVTEVPPALRKKVIDVLRSVPEFAYPIYQELLEDGIARELARISLPVSAYTEWYWKIDLHNLFHFLSLRADPHAQFEIRAYAEAVAACAKAVAPSAFAAFEEYALNAVNLSAHEARIVAKLIRGESPEWSDFAYFDEPTHTQDGFVNRSLTLRRKELADKLDVEVSVSE
ncbi:MAG TPA: FAD-dependent thymidylate synthase [Chloroflexota bacterium]|jgi:thymidylate synthase (FAD)|nr:FAD-dependent thymidylate synthase [Chloroflexota bacterium]